jgi:hypothetical protein
MYRLSRLLLIVAMLAGLYTLGILTWLAWPASGLLLGVFAFGRVGRRGYTYLTTLGSARWATEQELRKAGMLDAKSGLILGRMGGK